MHCTHDNVTSRKGGEMVEGRERGMVGGRGGREEE